MVHTIVIFGKGQVLLVVVNILPSEQDSIITQLLLHHPQSSINVFDTDKHDEHPPAKAEQLYSITMKEKFIIIHCIVINMYSVYHLVGQLHSPVHTLNLVLSTSHRFCL